MKKVIFLMIVCCLTIFALGIAWGEGDIEGQSLTSSEIQYGENNNGGWAEVESLGKFELSGVPSEGKTEVNAYTDGSINQENPNDDGFYSSSSFGFLEGGGTGEIVSGQGTQNIIVEGTLGNQSYYGNENCNGSAQFEAGVNLNSSSQGGVLNGSLHVEGYTYSSEKAEQNWQINNAGFKITGTDGSSGSFTVNGEVSTQNQRTGNPGANAQASTYANVTGEQVNNPGSMEAYGESFSYADGNYGEAKAHSFIKTE